MVRMLTKLTILLFLAYLFSDQQLRLHTSILSPPKLLQRLGTLLEPLLSRYPKFVSVLHDICEDGAAEEDQVFSTRRVFDADFKFLMCAIGTHAVGHLFIFEDGNG